MPHKVTNSGHRSWSMKRTADGHRDYTLTFRIKADSPRQGPDRILVETPGLPLPGTTWTAYNVAIGNTFCLDDWAWCRMDADIQPVRKPDDGPNEHWDITFLFSTRPPGRNEAWQNPAGQQFDNPLDTPDKPTGDTKDTGIGGTFVKKQTEAKIARFVRIVESDGSVVRTFSYQPIVNSSYEQVRGHAVEFDESHGKISIEQNVLSLQWALMQQMIDGVNSVTMWGLPVRAVKFQNATWDRKFYTGGFIYYNRKLEFETSVKKNALGSLVGGWDKELSDEGTKVLLGKWNSDPNSALYLKYVLEPTVDYNSPTIGQFQKFLDVNGHPTKTLLNGRGYPVGGDSALSTVPGRIEVQKYEEFNFLTSLGVPASF